MILLGQRPLTGSDGDHRLFVNRSSELRRVRRALELGLSVYLHGLPGSGRTSFLRQVQRTWPEARYTRLQGFETLTERLEQVERDLVGQEVLERQRNNPLAEVLGQFSSTQLKPPVDPLRFLRSEAVRTLGDRPHVVLVDDLNSDACHEMFGRLRDAMWELPIQWVVSGTASHLNPPVDTFFDVVVQLEPLDYEGLRELVRRRSESGTPDEQEMLHSRADAALEAVAPCTPRRALSVIRDLFLSDDIAAATGRLAALRLARSRLKTTAINVLDALTHYGPMHAGDEQLLADVGVTRSRVVQVLAGLEAEGLVAAQRSGRRKLYAALPSLAALPGATHDAPSRTSEVEPDDTAVHSERSSDSQAQPSRAGRSSDTFPSEA